MARIYISSTYRDLREHREAVYQALRRGRHDVVAMEDYVATDQRPLERCLADVAASDIYLGIVAWRYGYVPEQNNPGGHSITELEYREARRRGIPCLIFLLGESAPWPRSMIDNGGDALRIDGLRAELTREHLVSYFYTVGELAVATVTAVHRQITGQDPAGSSSESPEPAGARVLMLCAASDERLSSELGHHLLARQRDGVVAVVDIIPVVRDFAVNDAPERAIARADLVLLMVSGELASSGYLDTPELDGLLQLHRARRSQLLPVVLVAWSSLHPGLSRIPPLPGRDRSVVEASSREASFVEVVEGILLACLDIAAARAQPSRTQQRPVRAPPPGECFQGLWRSVGDLRRAGRLLPAEAGARAARPGCGDRRPIGHRQDDRAAACAYPARPQASRELRGAALPGQCGCGPHPPDTDLAQRPGRD